MPPVISFLVEWLKRYSLESPVFHKRLLAIGVVLQLITGIPQLLEWAGVALPATWQPLIEKILFFVGLGLSISSAATVKNSTAVVTNPVSDHKTVVVNAALPFTAHQETKNAAKDPLTDVVVTTTAPKAVV